jgi:hypothetical protein
MLSKRSESKLEVAPPRVSLIVGIDSAISIMSSYYRSVVFSALANSSYTKTSESA